MERINPVSSSGFQYLWSCAGGMNISEELLNITIIILVIMVGVSFKTTLLLTTAIVAAIFTAIFVILHVRRTMLKIKWPWHWIECIYVLIVAIALAVFSTVVLFELTKGYVLIGVLGYATSVIYFIDSFQKYQIAVQPAPRYAWTTPNMPDLNF